MGKGRPCVAQGVVGATTVGGTLVACRSAGIRVLATGGIGGVHRGYPARLDVSGDLSQLAHAPVVVFYSAEGGPPLRTRVDNAADAVRLARAHWALGGGAVVVAQPPSQSYDAEPLIADALAEA